MTKAERFERYVRLSFYINIVLSPAMTFGLVRVDVGDADAALVAALNLTQTAACLLLARAGVGHYLGERPQPRRLIAVATAVTVAGPAAAALASATAALRTGITMVLSMSYIAALSTATRPRTSVTAASAYCAAVLLLGGGFPAALTLAVLLGAVLLGYRVTLWMLRVVRELDRSRHVEAALAVAEERLRFSRDLHDVVGRTLSVVALKSELAAQLAKRGRGEAVEEMLEVRRVAQDALADLRAVVGGYRAADLSDELCGARALLASAGVTCTVTGDPATLPADVQGTLGWAVREATTNMLRHSEAATCTIALTSTPAAVTLTMTNDGVRNTATPLRFGGGLVGLSERVAALSGTLRAAHVPPDAFRVVVDLPAVTP
ncbi:sensor histidine kinase [Dactylosporangium darangshiense]|uniref:Histidine kinase n=1 Tax=Dactylosporangium darangshiense TaxID=579108 RepID=A0ABP8DRH5_9ACTN